jgi:transcriptional regulator with XRE-family HTH domain
LIDYIEIDILSHVTIVSQIREAARLTQVELAELGGTSQPTIAAYESGAKVPSLRTLRRLASAAGVELDLAVTTPMTREERRSLFLHRAIARRLAANPDAVIERAKSNLQVMADLHPAANDLLEEWTRLLDGSVEVLAETMTSRRPRARELRQVTPFAGVLTANERAQVYRAFRQAGDVA